MRRVFVAALAVAAALPWTVAAGAGGRAAAGAFTVYAHGFSSPVYVTSAPGDPTTLYVVERPGTIKIVKNGRIAGTFLDIRSLVKSGGELGLLSVAFHPRYSSNHLFYVSYTDA